jgi:hypothetical protein
MGEATRRRAPENEDEGGQHGESRADADVAEGAVRGVKQPIERGISSYVGAVTRSSFLRFESYQAAFSSL